MNKSLSKSTAGRLRTETPLPVRRATSRHPSVFAAPPVSRTCCAFPAATADSPQPSSAAPLSSSSSSTSSSPATKKWYALVANAEFFFNDVQNEAMAEQLRERVRFFKEVNREVDFWIVPEPTWLDSKFPNEAKMVRRPCVALVSSDEIWITFMKLRLDRVLRINLGSVPQEEALAVGGKVPDFKRPEKWTAPYAAYSPGWWNVFLPGGNN